MTTRRQFLVAGALAALNARVAGAQPRPVRIGILTALRLSESFITPGVVRRLGDLGYRQGSSMILEYRSVDGDAARWDPLARELIAAKCDIVFAVGPEQAARSLRNARAPMPVVFLANDYDPLEKRLVSSLRSPDGNMTGVYVPQSALVVKRLEILREVVPSARRVLVFTDVYSNDQIPAVRRAAEAAGIKLTVVEFGKVPYDYASAFEAGLREGIQGFVMPASPLFAGNGAIIAGLLDKHRLPSVAAGGRFPELGFLLSLGPDIPKMTARLADIGVRILKGTKPADIPVEQADEFELVINAKTAKTLGVKIPESVLARAVRIVQ